MESVAASGRAFSRAFDELEAPGPGEKDFVEYKEKSRGSQRSVISAASREMMVDFYRRIWVERMLCAIGEYDGQYQN